MFVNTDKIIIPALKKRIKSTKYLKLKKKYYELNKRFHLIDFDKKKTKRRKSLLILKNIKYLRKVYKKMTMFECFDYPLFIGTIFVLNSYGNVRNKVQPIIPLTYSYKNND